MNAGCRITTIQTLLGHRHPSSTLTYARIHNHTVAADYQAAMAVVEQRLVGSLNSNLEPELVAALNGDRQEENGDESRRLLALVESLELETLDQNQQALLAELRRGLQALAV